MWVIPRLGEISLVMGKDKAYELEGDAHVAVGIEKLKDDKTVRKSQWVHMRSKN